MRKVRFEDLGTREYQDTWDYQEQLFGENVNAKLAARRAEVAGEPFELHTQDHLLFVEHPHVYTLGKSGKPENLLIDEAGLKEVNATYLPINRGGDITYHGFGQLVAYPIFDLEHYFTDIHKFLRYLEEAIILTLADYGISAGRIDGLTGVWIEPDNMDRARKICAMGIRCSRWVTMHGLALNVNTDLKYFEYIVPCGIDDKAVTSMQAELGHEVSIEEVKAKVKFHIAQLFSIAFEE
ncbi:MAG: lipoyl(octanoyl) transferase LipB [Bacteroidetes bacterium]|nr:MAG: lipoyl(octanoyl) transferase LipB [Bacteroidota bacterium]